MKKNVLSFLILMLPMIAWCDNKPTIIHFSLKHPTEVNNHPLYDDCVLLPDQVLVPIKVVYDPEYYSRDPDVYWSVAPGGTFNEVIDFEHKRISLGTLTNLIYTDIYYQEVYWGIEPKATWTGQLEENETDVEISYEIPYDFEENYQFIWGTNFQFDLDGGGEIQFYDYKNEPKEWVSLSGTGIVGKYHFIDPNFLIHLKFFANSGKVLDSAKVIYDDGSIDNTPKEIVLKTIFNEELQCYELIPDNGYELDEKSLDLNGGWMNTIVVRFKDEIKEPTTIDFSLTKPTEVNGHALYDDCMMLFDKMNVSVNVCRTVSDGDPSNPQYSTVVDETYTAEVPGTFTQDVNLYNRFIDIDCESGLGDYAVYGFKPVASWDGTIEGADNDVDISYDIPLTNASGESNLPWIWGNNLQIDLDGNGSVQIDDNEETLSGTGIVYTLHEPDPETAIPTIRLFANPGKALVSLKLVYESGLDDKTVETVLNTTFNDELQCYELAPGEGYDVVDGRLVLNGGWMNTIVVRFKDAEPLELADDDSEKPAGEKNSALIKAKDGVMTDVVLSGRTLYKDNSWNTLCLPFSLTKDEIASSPLSGAIICTLNSGSVNRNLEYDNVWHVNLTFWRATAIEAGKPYIVEWLSGDAITDPKFENVTVEDAQNPITVADGHVVFTGYYDAFKATPNDDPMIYYLTDNNELKYTASDRVLKACRAYFTFTPGEGSGNAGGFTFDIDFGNGEETGIVTVLSPKGEANGHWYTLDGRRLDRKPSVKGVYINNGQKVVVK